MYLTDLLSGKEYEAKIESLSTDDFESIKNDPSRFENFNWADYDDKEVYKLILKNDTEILGLMCIVDHTDPLTNAIEIELLEVSKENIGATKRFDRIGGCLIAWACRESFKRGHDGYIFLCPKTNLIEHYIKQYGFYHMPIKTPNRPEGLMVLFGSRSQHLIQKYLA